MIRVADQISFWNGKIYVSIGYYASHLQHVFLHSVMSVAFGVYSAGRWIEFQHSTVRYDIDSVRMTQINVEPVIWAPVDANTSSSTVTILGVVVNISLTATDHVSYLLDSCSRVSLLHALRVLRSHGLADQSLKDVFRATVMMYCAPTSHGFCLASDYTRLNSFLHRAVKLGYYDKHSPTF